MRIAYNMQRQLQRCGSRHWGQNLIRHWKCTKLCRFKRLRPFFKTCAWCRPIWFPKTRRGLFLKKMCQILRVDVFGHIRDPRNRQNRPQMTKNGRFWLKTDYVEAQALCRRPQNLFCDILRPNLAWKNNLSYFL